MVFALYLRNKGAQRELGGTVEKSFSRHVRIGQEMKIPG